MADRSPGKWVKIYLAKPLIDLFDEKAGEMRRARGDGNIGVGTVAAELLSILVTDHPGFVDEWLDAPTTTKDVFDLIASEKKGKKKGKT